MCRLAEVPVSHLVGVGRRHQQQLIGEEVGHDGASSKIRAAAAPRKSSLASSLNGRARAAVEGPLHGQERMVRREQDPAPAAPGPHEAEQGRVHVFRQVGRVREVEIGPLEHVLDEELLVGVAHVGADHHQIGEIDQHVLEQHRVLTPGTDPRTRGCRC